MRHTVLCDEAPVLVNRVLAVPTALFHIGTRNTHLEFGAHPVASQPSMKVLKYCFCSKVVVNDLGQVGFNRWKPVNYIECPRES